ncbi:unnamed protein product, partial [Prorocentrum cordatum]
PICVRYAGVIPRQSVLTRQQARTLQAMLVTIWSRHIARYHEGEKLRGVELGTNAAPAHENGHALAQRPGGKPGVWCRKCGKFVERLQHVRLKITGKPCEQAALPPDRWLTQ